MNASGMIEPSDDSSVQIVRTNDTANLTGSSNSGGKLDDDNGRAYYFRKQSGLPFMVGKVSFSMKDEWKVK